MQNDESKKIKIFLKNLLTNGFSCGIIKSESKGRQTQTKPEREKQMRKTLETLIEANLKNQQAVKDHPTMSPELKEWNLARLQGYLVKYQKQLENC